MSSHFGWRTHVIAATTFLALFSSNELCASTTTLSFDSPVPATLNDSSGQGTGFTTRLPGTGSAIAANEPHVNIDTGNGRLVLTSTYSSPNFGNAGLENNAANLVNTDMPTLLLSGIGGDNFIVRARFSNLAVPAASDQIGVLVGSSINNVTRGGIFWGNSGNTVGFNYAQNGFDGPPTDGLDNAFQSGQDGEFEFGRIGGAWYFSWKNLSTNDGDTYGFSLPNLDSQNDLYVGIFNLDTYGYAPAPYDAYLESFTVLTGASVPEPSTLVLGLGGVSLLAVWRLRVGKAKRL